MHPNEPQTWAAIDAERRFGGLRRLYGDPGYAAVRRLRVAVVGIGGVGSWAAEALARCGVASLCLIDLDHIAESNINRQVHANSGTLGQSKVLAMAERVAQIHPGCGVEPLDAFVEPGNWPALLPGAVDAVIDACDQADAKLAMAAWALEQPGVTFVTCGAAGGKQQGHLAQVADLALVSHDPLLARLRQRLRKQHGARGAGQCMGVSAVYSREPVVRPSAAACEGAEGGAVRGAAAGDGNTDHSLNCHGYGSSVTVTAAFGMAAAGHVLMVAAGKA